VPDPTALSDGGSCRVLAKSSEEMAEDARRNEQEALKFATFVRPDGDSRIVTLPATTVKAGEGGESVPPVFVDVQRILGHLEQLSSEIQDRIATIVQAKIQEVLQKLRVG
jgi:hypothetical protein